LNANIKDTLHELVVHVVKLFNAKNSQI